MSVDPSLDSAKVVNPQSWNRYAYTYNNPLKYTHPTGEAVDGQDVLDFFTGAVHGAGAVVTFGLAEKTTPKPSDSNASLLGQIVGTVAATDFGVSAGTTEAITAPAAATGVGAVVPAAGVGYAISTGVSGLLNLLRISQEATNRGRENETGYYHPRDTERTS